jgi:hypothetical protein
MKRFSRPLKLPVSLGVGAIRGRGGILSKRPKKFPVVMVKPNLFGVASHVTWISVCLLGRESVAAARRIAGDTARLPNVPSFRFSHALRLKETPYSLTGIIIEAINIPR